MKTNPRVNFNVPIAQQTKVIKKSSLSNGNITSTCFNYGWFAIIETNDPGLMGSAAITIRYRSKQMNSSSICHKNFKGKTLSLTDYDGYFWGVKGNYLFIAAADSFGAERKFQVFELTNGKLIYHDIKNDNENFTITQHKQQLTLYYFKGLNVSCNLAQDTSECWKKTLIDNNIPASLKLMMPDCRESFINAHSPLDNKAQVSTLVKVANLAMPTIEYLGGKTTCHPRP